MKIFQRIADDNLHNCIVSTQLHPYFQNTDDAVSSADFRRSQIGGILVVDQTCPPRTTLVGVVVFTLREIRIW